MKASPLVVLLAWSGLLIDQPTLLAQEVQPSTWQAKYRSGRIDALKRQLASGNTSTDDGATARYRCVVSDRACPARRAVYLRSEEHTSELQSRVDLVCRLLLEKKNKKIS